MKEPECVHEIAVMTVCSVMCVANNEASNEEAFTPQFWGAVLVLTKAEAVDMLQSPILQSWSSEVST